MVLLALLAPLAGLDADSKWGPFRLGLLLVGLLALILRAVLKGVAKLDQAIISREWETEDGLEGAKRPRLGSAMSKRLAGYPDPSLEIRLPPRWLGILLLGLVMILYVGFISVWRWNDWPQSSQYYSALAQAFLRGETAFPVEPAPELAELDNPYSPEERAGIGILGDFSYYRGKYFMYWGPAPAGLLAVWLLIGGFPIGEEIIVFLAITTIFLFSGLILLWVRNRYFRSLPTWVLGIGLLTITTAHPLLWVLNTPRIYEAAIASGQAFLVAGLFFSLPIIDRSRISPWRGALVGGLWALAIGSRLTLTFAVTVLVLGLALISFRRHHRRMKWSWIAPLTILVFFVLSGLALLGLYNQIRFGSFLETGLGYQMTPVDVRAQFARGHIFSIQYLPPNMLYYLLAPIKIIPSFPFIRPQWGPFPPFSQFLARLNIPAAWGMESVAGLLFSLPTLLFAATLAADLLCFGRIPSRGVTRSVASKVGHVAPSSRAIAGLMLIAGCAAAVPVLFYTYVSTRFMFDAIPLLALCAVIGAWRIYLSNRPWPIRRRLTNIVILLAVGISALVSLLLAMSGALSRFDDMNPELYRFLVELFSP
jgi:hypothetical protein